MGNAVRGRNGGDGHEKEWAEIERLLGRAAAAVRARDLLRVELLAERVVFRVLAAFTRPPIAPRAVTLRWRGWSYEDIAATLATPSERVTEIIAEWSATAHVRAMDQKATSRVDRWPIDWLDIEHRIVIALRDYAVVTVGQLVHIGRGALEAMDGLSAHDVREVLVAIHAAADDGVPPSVRGRT